MEVVHVRGMLDNKQQEIEALERRLAHSQTCLANSERRAQAWQHELSYTQERLQVMHDFLPGPAPLGQTHLDTESMASASTTTHEVLSVYCHTYACPLTRVHFQHVSAGIFCQIACKWTQLSWIDGCFGI